MGNIFPSRFCPGIFVPKQKNKTSNYAGKIKNEIQIKKLKYEIQIKNENKIQIKMRLVKTFSNQVDRQKNKNLMLLHSVKITQPTQILNTY